MAVDNFNIKNVPSVTLTLTDSAYSGIVKTPTLKAGYYEISYAPSDGVTILVMSSGAAETIASSGTGAIAHSLTGPIGFLVSDSNNRRRNIAVILRSIDVDVVSSSPSAGTLETLSASGTYTQTGTAKVVAIGGGQGGFHFQPGPSGPGVTGGKGGAGGRVVTGTVTLTGNIPVTIGAGGVPQTNITSGSGGVAGGNTIFGPLNSSTGTAGGAGGDGLFPVPPATPPSIREGTPGQAALDTTGMAFLIAPTSPKGVTGGVKAYGRYSSSGGGILAGGGGGHQNIGGGGGGGGVVGGNPAVLYGPLNPSGGTPAGRGGLGGDGRVFLVRI